MTKFVFIRHLPTDSNLGNVFMGRLDCDIAREYDERLVSELRETLAKSGFDAIFSSPLKRCLQTAEIVFPNMQTISDQRLAEKDLGDWQGLSKAQVCTRYPDSFGENGGMNITMSAPNGESFQAVCERVTDFLNWACRNYPNKTLVIFSHGGVIATILYFLCAETPQKYIHTKNIGHLIPYELEIECPVVIPKIF